MRRQRLLSLPSGSALTLLASLAAAGCTNEASTEPGDKPADAGAPTALGSGLRIAEINSPGSSVRPVPNQENVYVTGAQFIVEDTYAETGLASSVGSIYVEDVRGPGVAAIPYSGIELYKTTFEPASLVLAPGDVIDFTGEYQEYDGPSSFSFGGKYQPEMYEPIATFRFDYSPPTPTIIPISDLTSWNTGYQWMSMLVTVNDTYGGTFTEDGTGRCGVYLTSNTGQSGVYMDNELFNLPCTAPQFGPDAGAGTVHFTSVTGIVTYFGNFTLSPRSAADIVVAE